MTIEYIKDKDFTTKVYSAEGVKILVFYAEWCPHCHRMLPPLQELDKAYGTKIKIFIINVENAPKACAKYEVKAIPMLCFLKNGKEKDRIAGEETLEVLQEKISQLL